MCLTILRPFDLEADECSHDGTQEEENGEDDAVMEDQHVRSIWDWL